MLETLKTSLLIKDKNLVVILFGEIILVYKVVLYSLAFSHYRMGGNIFNEKNILESSTQDGKQIYFDVHTVPQIQSND